MAITNISSIKDQIETLRQDIIDLEIQLPIWEPDNLASAKKTKLIAHRIVQSSQRLETLVKEKNT